MQEVVLGWNLAGEEVQVETQWKPHFLEGLVKVGSTVLTGNEAFQVGTPLFQGPVWQALGVNRPEDVDRWLPASPPFPWDAFDEGDVTAVPRLYHGRKEAVIRSEVQSQHLNQWIF